MFDHHYSELLKESIESGQTRNETEPRKRRRIGLQGISNSESADNAGEANKEVITVSDSGQESEDSINSSDFEDISLDNRDESYNFLPYDAENSDDKQELLSIAIQPVQEKGIKKTRKFTSISKKERELRKVIHKMYLGLMLSHGSVRNRWCNDYKLLMKLRENISPQVLELIHQKESRDMLPIVKSRRFLDGLKKLMIMYSSKFRVTSQGLVRKNWNELSIKQAKVEANVTFEKFAHLVTNFRGSRDIGAQGFVGLLRSVGLNARLIFSLQPPDFTSIAEFPKIDAADQNKLKDEAACVKQNFLLKKFSSQNNKRKLLASVREKPTTVTDNFRHENYFENSPYPIFWVEVWDKYVQKWISIDPIELQMIEIAPMRRKCKFEPPSTDTRNQLLYAIAYDRLGGVKDVTRRYSQYYNAKTVKKKIHFISEEEENWYNRILKASCLAMRRNKINKLDILESKEFYNRDLAEGVPNSITDFKNHPVYALESQLKQNEIIYPKDETSTCGFFRNKLSKKSQAKGQEVIPIYKRSHVYTLRSAKAWYLRGRVLKVGVQPLKLKKKQLITKQHTSDEDEDEETTRLYAEFQTKIYNPPPIIDGVIPKNAYGNVDIYTPSMIPENGYLVKATPIFSMKLIEKAAKIIEIDYAKAIIAFDFVQSDKKKRYNRNPTAREGGVLIDIRHREAMYLVLNELAEEEENLRKRALEMNSLNNWKYFLTKLRISERLNKEHGKLNNEDDELIISEELESDDFSVRSDNSGSDRDDFGGGGFFIDGETTEDMDNNSYLIERNISPDFIEEYEGNNLASYPCSQEEENQYSEGSLKDFQGGFVVDDDNIKTTTNSPSKNDESCEVEDIAEEFFKLDNNGELIYDPTNENPKMSDVISYPADKKRQMSGSSHNEFYATFKSQKASTDLTTDVNADANVRVPSTVMNENEPSEPSSLNETSGTSSQASLGSEIAEQEKEFGFEYSDTD